MERGYVSKRGNPTSIIMLSGSWFSSSWIMGLPHSFWCWGITNNYAWLTGTCKSFLVRSVSTLQKDSNTCLTTCHFKYPIQMQFPIPCTMIPMILLVFLYENKSMQHKSSWYLQWSLPYFWSTSFASKGPISGMTVITDWSLLRPIVWQWVMDLWGLKGPLKVPLEPRSQSG